MNPFTLLCTALCLSLSLAWSQPLSFTIDLDQQQQEMVGFGTSLINFGSYWQKYPALYRTAAFQAFYVQTMGMNMLRCNLWGGVLMQPVENWQDISYEKFDLMVSQVKQPGNRRDMQVFVDFAQAMIELNPEARIIGTVWTPPPWMKLSGELTDTAAGAIFGDRYVNRQTQKPVNNRLNPAYFKHYAKYLVEWVKLFEHHTGKPLYGISIGNEVMFTQSFGSCVWTAEDYGKMVVELGQMLAAEGYEEVIIYGPETMTSHNHADANPLYLKELTEGPAAQYLDVFATHGYVDGFEAEYGAESQRSFRRLIEGTGKPFWITEGGTGGHRWPEPLSGIAAALFNAVVYGQAAAFTPWQITDPHPNTHGMMVYDLPTPKTYAAQHFFRFIEAGARRIEVTPFQQGVSLAAFFHPENRTLTAVLINPGKDAATARLTLQGNGSKLGEVAAFRTSETERLHPIAVTAKAGVLAVALPPYSIVTVQGRVE